MPDTVERPQEESNGKTRRSRRGYFLAIAATLLVVFLAIPYAYTSNPKSCTLCHNMDDYYESWKNSTHATAASNCFECHVKEGAASIWVYRISFYREIYTSIVGADLKPAGASVPGVDSCQRQGCHSLNRVSSASGDIKIDHRGHVTKANLSCTQCHPGAAHPNVGKTGALIPARKMCKGCHATRMNDCSFCHIKKHVETKGFVHD
ncbi:MAG: NapC/NirT family cytochrome c [Candidatus Aquicultor sp.]|nr:NapC/NirT family cytochrome c [Candidatus Aquicultor sp.]